MAAGLFPIIQFFDDNGDPLNAGLIYTYEPGSTTSKTSYQDGALTTAHANPIVLTAAGRLAAPLWCDGETKLVVKTAAGVSINPTIDNFNADPAGLGDYSTKNSGVSTKTAAYDMVAGDDGKLIVATSGTWTLGTAVAASTLKDGWTVWFINSGTGTVTFNPFGAETANGASTITFAPGEHGHIRCDGSNFRVLRAGRELLATASQATGATIDFTSLITSDYALIMLEFDDLVPATDTADLYLRTSSDNGSTFDSGASAYGWARNSLASTPSNTAAGSASDSEIELAANLGNAADEQASGVIWLFNPAKGGQRPRIGWQIAYQSASDAMALSTGMGERGAVSTVNAFRLLMSAGNITTINYSLYGFRAA